jgi:two-component system nitrogen regulation response regulator GlnG/two-component system response regulator HydG
VIDPRTRSDLSQEWGDALPRPTPELPHLVIAWSREEPHRIGEAATIEGRCILGRGTPEPDDPEPRSRFYQQRPWGVLEMPPLEASTVSRRQLELSPLPDGSLEVTSMGRCPLILHGEVVRRGIVRPGDTVTLQNALVLFVVRRRSRWDMSETDPPTGVFPFGKADPHGLVGESPTTWMLRKTLTFAAQAENHVLVHGESGVGKELAARSIHALSRRAGGAFVARNAATFPEGLIDAELFGNVRGFPHAASPERRGGLGLEIGDVDVVEDALARDRAHRRRARAQRVVPRRVRDHRRAAEDRLVGDRRLHELLAQDREALSPDDWASMSPRRGVR